MFQSITILSIQDDNEEIFKHIQSVTLGARLERDTVTFTNDLVEISVKIKSRKNLADFDIQRNGLINFINSIPCERPKAQELLAFQAQYINSMLSLQADVLDEKIYYKAIEIVDKVGGVVFIDGKAFLDSRGQLITTHNGESHIDTFKVTKLATD